MVVLDIHLIRSCWSHTNLLLLLLLYKYPIFILNYSMGAFQRHKDSINIFSWITVLISCRPWSTHSLVNYLFRNPVARWNQQWLQLLMLIPFYHIEHNPNVLSLLWFHQAIGLLNNNKWFQIKINFDLKLMRKLEESTLVLS